LPENVHQERWHSKEESGRRDGACGQQANESVHGAGHVHYVELDQFIGPRYLVTVHGPVNPAVTPEAAERETRAVLRRIEAGRLRPRPPFELSYAIVSSLSQSQSIATGQHWLDDPPDLQGQHLPVRGRRLPAVS